MKIGILIDQFSPGATPKWTGLQARYFHKLGHETEIVAIMEGGLPKGNYQFKEFLEGVPIRYLSREYRFLNAFNFKLPMFVSNLMKKIV